MEMLVVVAIIVALAGIGGFFLLGQLDDSKKSTARIQVKGPLSAACQAYYVKHGSWPDGLEQLVEPDPEFKVRFLESKDALYDPWGKAYIYGKDGGNNKGTRPDISAVAPDGEIIGNWSKKQ